MVKPIKIEYEDGRKYILEYNREAVTMAEADGFDFSDIDQKPMTRTPQIFHYAFWMHHPEMTREQTDAILFNDLGGVTQGLMERLGELFNAPFNSLVREEGEKPKNASVKVTL